MIDAKTGKTRAVSEFFSTEFIIRCCEVTTYRHDDDGGQEQERAAQPDLDQLYSIHSTDPRVFVLQSCTRSMSYHYLYDLEHSADDDHSDKQR